MAPLPRAGLMSSCRARDLGGGPRVELGKDVGDVGLDGVAGQEQLAGDVGIGQPLADKAGDLLLGGGECLPASGWAAAGAAFAAAGVVLAPPGVGAHGVPLRAEAAVDGDGAQVGGGGRPGGTP